LNVARREIDPEARVPRSVPVIVVRSEPPGLANLALNRPCEIFNPW
jgi:hypothetical protein